MPSGLWIGAVMILLSIAWIVVELRRKQPDSPAHIAGAVALCSLAFALGTMQALPNGVVGRVTAGLFLVTSLYFLVLEIRLKRRTRPGN